MTLTALTYLILELNGSIDTGRHQTLGIEDVKVHIERGDTST